MKTPDPLILLTRPQASAQGFADRLRQAGVTVPILISPLLEIRSAPPPSLDGVRGVIFTSKNGVESVPGAALAAWCVGDATAAAAKARGWRAVSAGGDAEALCQRVLADAPDAPLMHLRGAHARGDIAQRLTLAGIETHEAVVYHQDPMPLSSEAISALSGDNPVILPLFSPRTARLLASRAPFSAPLRVVVISQATADALGDLPQEQLHMADKPDATAMLRAILALIRPEYRIEDRGDLA